MFTLKLLFPHPPHDIKIRCHGEVGQWDKLQASGPWSLLPKTLINVPPPPSHPYSLQVWAPPRVGGPWEGWG